MSRDTFIKWIWGFFGAHILTILGFSFLLGSWTQKNNEHLENKEIHKTPTELNNLYMPKDEINAHFKNINYKLDWLIETEKNKK